MKKVLFATVAAVMSTTAAMADVGFSEGRITALMTAANNFESRGINIVENSNKLAVHKTVTAWNQGWNALEGENTIDLGAKVHVTTLYTSSHGVLTVETDNIVVSEDGMSSTVTTGEGDVYTILAADVNSSFGQNVSMRDSRAAEISVEEGTALDAASNSYADEVTVSIAGTGVAIDALDSFNEVTHKVKYAIQNSYDAGFEDGYTAGYDDGFAAAKGVVKN